MAHYKEILIILLVKKIIIIINKVYIHFISLPICIRTTINIKLIMAIISNIILIFININ